MPTEMSAKRKGASRHTGTIPSRGHNEAPDPHERTERRQRKIREMKRDARDTPKIGE